MGGPKHRISPIAPPEIGIHGIHPVARTFHHDPRGFLVETMRADDPDGLGSRFRMSYSSLTQPGRYRDENRWHLHRVQTDRFVVVLGEMILALCDHRPESPTHDRLAVVRMSGAAYSGAGGPGAPSPTTSYLVPIPPGVLHCIGNLSDRPFLLTNFPTELYDARDEGRVPFGERTIPSLDGPFSWDLVDRPG